MIEFTAWQRGRWGDEISALLRATPDLLPELLAGQVRAETVNAAERAGADPDGLFCAAAVAPACSLMGSAWPDTGPWSEVIVQDDAALVLAQVSHIAELASLVAPLAAGHPIGFGVVRQGWAGAGVSCHDALDAHRLAVARGADTRFADDWAAATLLAARDRLTDSWALGEVVAARNAHLADAVRAFAEHGFSVVAASRVLYIHPNTEIYRLERWQQLTGWDPRSYTGLVMSMACLEAVR